MENREYYIYRHIRLDTNEVFYIGLGSYQKERYKRAYAKSKKCRTSHWHNIVKQCGYKVQIMLEDLTEKEAIEKEIELIALYGRRDLSKGTLINLTDGGESNRGFVYTQEERKKRSDIQKNLYANGYINPNKGRKFSETPGYVNPKKGKKISDEHKKKMSQNHQSKKEGYVNPMKGVNFSEDHKLKLKISIKEYFKKEENRNKVSEKLKEMYKNGYVSPFSKMVINSENGFFYNSSKEAWIASGMNCHKDHFRAMLSGRKTNKTNFQYV